MEGTFILFTVSKVSIHSYSALSLQNLDGIAHYVKNQWRKQSPLLHSDPGKKNLHKDKGARVPYLIQRHVFYDLSFYQLRYLPPPGHSACDPGGIWSIWDVYHIPLLLLKGSFYLLLKTISSFSKMTWTYMLHYSKPQIFFYNQDWYCEQWIMNWWGDYGTWP